MSASPDFRQSPRNGSVGQPIVESAGLQLSYEDQADFRARAVRSIDEVKIFREPDYSETKLGGIPLNPGGMPVNLRDYLGGPHRRLSLDTRSIKGFTDLPMFALLFEGDYPILPHTVIAMQDTADKGYEHHMGIRRGSEKGLARVVNIGDVCLALDSMVPPVSPRAARKGAQRSGMGIAPSTNIPSFLEVVDPRSSYSFGEIARTITAHLRPVAGTAQTINRYHIDKPIGGEHIPTDGQPIGYTQASITIINTKGKPAQYTISYSAPFELEQGTVTQHVLYSFLLTKRPNGQGKVNLVSDHVPRQRLRELARAQVQSIDAINICHKALSAFLQPFESAN